MSRRDFKGLGLRAWEVKFKFQGTSTRLGIHQAACDRFKLVCLIAQTCQRSARKGKPETLERVAIDVEHFQAKAQRRFQPRTLELWGSGSIAQGCGLLGAA